MGTPTILKTHNIIPKFPLKRERKKPQIAHTRSQRTVLGFVQAALKGWSCENVFPKPLQRKALKLTGIHTQWKPIHPPVEWGLF